MQEYILPIFVLGFLSGATIFCFSYWLVKPKTETYFVRVEIESINKKGEKALCTYCKCEVIGYDDVKKHETEKYNIITSKIRRDFKNKGTTLTGTVKIIKFDVISYNKIG